MKIQTCIIIAGVLCLGSIQAEEPNKIDPQTGQVEATPTPGAKKKTQISKDTSVQRENEKAGIRPDPNPGTANEKAGIRGGPNPDKAGIRGGPSDPGVVTLTQQVRIKTASGETVLPVGMKLPIVSRGKTTVRVQYKGQTQTIPVASTDLKKQGQTTTNEPAGIRGPPAGGRTANEAAGIRGPPCCPRGVVTNFRPGDSITLQTDAGTRVSLKLSKTIGYFTPGGKRIDPSMIRKDSVIESTPLKRVTPGSLIG